MDEQVRLGHQIIEFYEKLSSWEHGVVRGKEITLPQMHTLEILGVHGPLRMKELALKMGVTTGTLTVLVNRLEEKGLVRREPNPADGRSFLVGLTETGADLYREHDQLHAGLTRELTAGLTMAEIAALADILERMNAVF